MYNILAEVVEFRVNRVFNPLSHLHGWITQKDGLCCRGDHDDDEEEEEDGEEEEEMMLEMEMTKMMMRAMVVIMVVTITMPRLVSMMTVSMCL